MDNKANNGYPYDANHPTAPQQYMNSQIPAHMQLPPSYNSVMSGMTAQGYSPYPPGVAAAQQQQAFYANSWGVDPAAQQAAAAAAAASMQYGHHMQPPPPYAATAHPVATMPMAHPSMYQYPITTTTAPQGAQQSQVYQTQVYPVPGAMYDSGARFGASGGTASIPPPPPGIAPNAAQIAAMQGQQVVMTKKKNSFLHGGNGAGFTFW